MTTSEHQLKHIELFEKKYEYFNLGLGVFFVFVCIIDCVSNTLNPKPVADQILRFIAGGIFLNSVHVYFTYALLLCVPEIRRWLTSLTKNELRIFMLKSGFVFTASTAYFFAAYNVYDSAWWVLYIGALIFYTIPIHHGVTQNMGISLLYNKKISLEGLSKLEKTERMAFKALLFFYITYSAFYFMSLRSHNYIHQGLLMRLTYSLYTFSILLILGVGLKVSIYAKQYNKFIFLCRLLVLLFVPFSFIALVSYSALHGIEYLGISKKMNLPTSALIVASILGFSLLLLCPFDGLTLLIWNNYVETPLILRIIAGISFGLTFLHYYIDRNLFNSGYKSSRENIFPLFTR